MRISGYVPCFNDEATVIEAVRSLREQTRALDEIFVVDDGSTDASANRLKRENVRVVSLDRNSGRGAARACAMKEASGQLILACDATARLEKDFLQRALPYFENKKIAAVVGRIFDERPRGVTGRWRNRHLFRASDPQEARHHSWLATWAVLMRRDAVLEVGNFNESCRHSEDAELGRRLASAGWDIVFEPAATVHPLNENSVGELLERYWRWHAGVDETFRFKHYLKQVAYSLHVLAARDLRAGDPLAALISLCTPHYALWRAFRS